MKNPTTNPALETHLAAHLATDRDADAAFRRNRNLADILAAIIQGHDMTEGAETVHWGHAGTAGHVAELLAEAAFFQGAITQADYRAITGKAI